MNQAPEVSLPCFEGPLDLLLTLVRRNQMEITDIPIAEITRQYLEHLRQADEQRMDLGAEFVEMAAVLIHIKSKCLLATDPEMAAAEPDPREDLIRQLLDHQQVRQAAEFLGQKLELEGASWSRPTEKIPEEPPEWSHRQSHAGSARGTPVGTPSTGYSSDLPSGGARRTSLGCGDDRVASATAASEWRAGSGRCAEGAK